MKHEPTLMIGPKYSYVPACTCGWRGDPLWDKGEATRKAYGHVQHAGREDCTCRAFSGTKDCPQHGYANAR